MNVRIVLWPYVAVAVALLLLALLAPRTWRPEARDVRGPSIPRVGAGPLAEATPLCAPGAEPAGCPAIPPPLAAEAIPAPLAEASPLEKEILGPVLGAEGQLPRTIALPRDLALETVPPSELAQHYSRPATSGVAAPQPLAIAPPTAELYAPPPALARLPEAAAPPLLRGPERDPAGSRWPRPTNIAGYDAPWPIAPALLEQIARVRGLAPAPEWSDQVQDQLRRLAATAAVGAPEAVLILDRLLALADAVDAIDVQRFAQDPQGLAELTWLRRASYALRRRVDLWKQTHRVLALAVLNPSQHTVSTATLEAAARDLRPLLAQLEPQLGSPPSKATWQAHLRWEELVALSAPERSGERAARGDLARQVLRNLEQSKRGTEQSAFLRRAPWPAFEAELRTWAAAAPIDYGAILAAVEQFEATHAAEDARAVTDAIDRLRYQPGEAAELLHLLEAHYRNANLRLAISGEFLNRLLPKVNTQAEAVDDEILGARVQGVTVTLTKLFVRLMPDRRRVRLGLEAHGVVSSETESHRGPARIYSEGASQYSARKELLADRNGLRVTETQANAWTGQQNTDVGTQFDSIPLFGAIARSIAQRQYDLMEADARREVEGKIAARARERLDAEVHRQLAKAEADFNQKVLGLMQKLGLKPTALDMQTTTDRIVSRMRLADDHQLAAFTPRCQAPGDSLLSVQFHESALNNALEQLRLHGRELGVEELFRELTTALGLKDQEMPEDLPDDVRITFADQQPIRVTFADAQVTIEVRVEKLVRGEAVWKDFAVRSHWKPEATGRLDTSLARDGVVELIGKRLNVASQVSLRAIFGKVFSKNARLQLLPDQIVTDPRLADLRLTQLEFVDGWISIALGVDRETLARQRANSRR